MWVFSAFSNFYDNKNALSNDEQLLIESFEAQNSYWLYEKNGFGNSLNLWTGMIVDRPMINSLSSLKFVTLLPQG